MGKLRSSPSLTSVQSTPRFSNFPNLFIFTGDFNWKKKQCNTLLEKTHALNPKIKSRIPYLKIPSRLHSLRIDSSPHFAYLSRRFSFKTFSPKRYQKGKLPFWRTSFDPKRRENPPPFAQENLPHPLHQREGKRRKEPTLPRKKQPSARRAEEKTQGTKRGGRKDVFSSPFFVPNSRT